VIIDFKVTGRGDSFAHLPPIPLSIEGGQFRWFIHGGGRLIGRAEMLSVSRGIISSYSCYTPCPPIFDRAFVDPDPVTVGEGDATSHAVLEIDVDIYSNEYGPFAANVVNSWSWNTSIATLNFGSVTGIDVGSTNTTSTVEFPIYWWDNSTQDCTFFGNNETNAYGSVQVDPTVTVTSVGFNPTTIARVGSQSTLTVQLSASTGVPPSTTVDIEVFQHTNPNNVSLTITDSGTKLGQAVTAGQVSTSTFTVRTPTGNETSAGTVTYKARITAIHVQPNSPNVQAKPVDGEGVVSEPLCIGTCP
jgi:hypothetical protein